RRDDARGDPAAAATDAFDLVVNETVIADRQHLPQVLERQLARVDAANQLFAPVIHINLVGQHRVREVFARMTSAAQAFDQDAVGQALQLAGSDQLLLQLFI